MVGKRFKDRELTNSRIYKRHKKYYYFSPIPYINPKTNKIARWHSLCDISEGELKARSLAQQIISFNTVEPDEGDMPTHLASFLVDVLRDREDKKPTDKEKLKMFNERNKNIETIINVIKRAFFEFDVSIVAPVDVAQFLDVHQNKRRMTQVYRSTLSDFFKYTIRKGLRDTNPVVDITVKTPVKRNVYITHEQFLEIRKAFLTDKNGKKVPTGLMIQCYVDLCYLMYQRLTEIRLLKWDQIKEDGVYFLPSKTEYSSGADVIIPMTDEIKEVLKVVKSIEIDSDYVICTKRGEPYAATGLRTAWKRACARVGISGLTLKDLRPKSLTDASTAGFKIEQISVGAAHTDKETTQGYIKIKPIPISEVNLKLPEK